MAGDLGEWRPFAVHRVASLWVRESNGGPWRWPVNLEPRDATTWSYRRNRRVVRARHEAIVSLDGLPCTVTAVQLLWESSNPTEKDERDRAVVEPLLRTQSARGSDVRSGSPIRPRRGRCRTGAEIAPCAPRAATG